MPDINQGDAARRRSREVDMDLEEMPGNEGAFLLHIHAPVWAFSYVVPSWKHLTETLEFFRSTHGTQVFAKMAIGTCFSMPVNLIKDSEFADRFWIRAYQEGNLGQMLEFTLSGDFLTAFMAELAYVVAEHEPAK